MKTIEIKCRAAELIPLNELTILQGKLKDMSEKGFKDLRKSILENGFSVPFFVWKDNNVNNILDGTHRKLVLHELEKEGYQIPPLPVAFIEADNLEQAKTKLLFIASQFAKITGQGLYEFAQGIDFKKIAYDLDLPSFSMDKFVEEYFEGGETGPAPNEKELDENISTSSECPSCGYKW